MASKDVARRNRRVVRRGSSDTNQAPSEAEYFQDFAPEQEAAPAQRKGGVMLPREALLRLPTPSRTPPPRHESTYEASYPPVPPLPGSSGPQLGPEPWGVSDSSASTSARGNYREWLQARGQQAMQRSIYGGGNGMPGTPTSGHMTPTSGHMTPQAKPAALLGTVPLNASPPHKALGQVPSVPSPVASQWAQQAGMPQFGPGLDVFGSASCGAQPFASGACSPQMLGSAGCATQGFSFPTNPQMPPVCVNSGNAYSRQQDLVAHLMPELMMMDREVLAEQLRMAAPCCYDD